MGCDDCGQPIDLAHATRGYRRALVLVIVLNLAMGVAEMTGGFFGASQALKADSLDFLGDGLITMLGLLAISRGPRWRARAALLQGVFLAMLAVGVIMAAAYRILEKKPPEANVMSLLGLLALAVNVSAALILIPHRHGDANIRAVWLFSRNDALGNLAVVVAGGLVHATRSAWPDIVAATIIAVLFLTSAIEIIRKARAELRSPISTRPDLPP